MCSASVSAGMALSLIHICYSGTACWCREQPLTVTAGIGIEQHDHEGRVLTLEYPEFWLVNCYTPVSYTHLRCTSVRPSKSNSTASRLPPSYFSLLKSTSVSSACFSAQTRRITASASGAPP